MPYIIEDQRDYVDEGIDGVLCGIADCKDRFPNSVDGVLNYTVSTIVADAINPGRKAWSYADIARATAVFECAKLEFYRRVAGPKEDLAITANGDIPSYGGLPG